MLCCVQVTAIDISPDKEQEAKKLGARRLVPVVSGSSGLDSHTVLYKTLQNAIWRYNELSYQPNAKSARLLANLTLTQPTQMQTRQHFRVQTFRVAPGEATFLKHCL